MTRSTTRPGRRRPWALPLLGLVLACAGPDTTTDHGPARALIRQTTGLEAVHDPDGPVLSAAELDGALADGLGLDEALSLALRNNRHLQAGFQRLGMARADVVQAGLLQNPTLSLSFLFPNEDGRVRLGAGLMQSLTELWHLDERQERAERAYQEQLLSLGRQAGELVAATRRAYLDALRDTARRELLAEALELDRRSLTLAQARREAGAGTGLDVQAALDRSLRAELAARAATLDASRSRRALAALLSLTGDLLDVPLVDELPSSPGPPLDREAVVAMARQRRLDRRALAAEVATAELQLELERDHAKPHVSAGLAHERPESSTPTDHVLGPTVAVELPLFDRNQAGISRAAHDLARLRLELEALDAELAQQVRNAWDRAASAAAGARFASSELVPSATRTARLADQARERGDLTSEQALAAARSSLEAHLTALDGRHEAALATVALELAVGAPLESLGDDG